MIKRAKKIIDTTGVLWAIVGTILIMFLMMYIVVSVSLRLFAGKPLMGDIEIGMLLLPIIGACSYTYADIHNMHIRATLIFSKFNDNTQRKLDSIYSFISGIIFIIVGWRVFIYGFKSMQMGAESSVLGLPTYPFHFVYSIILSTFAVYMFIKAIYLLIAVNKREFLEE